MSDLSHAPDSGTLSAVTRQADQKFCFSCGNLLHVSAAACPSCGANQTPQVTAAEIAPSSAMRTGLVAVRPGAAGLSSAQSMFCFGCGAQIHQAAYACPNCGAAQRGSRPHAPRKDRTVAIVLAFLLGGIGVHRFYLGNIWLGLLYLVFCWTFIPALIATVEGIVFISTSDAEFQRKYGELR